MGRSRLCGMEAFGTKKIKFYSIFPKNRVKFFYYAVSRQETRKF